jgi:hypothetical protein
MIQLSRRTVALALAAFLALTAVATTSLVLTLTGRAEANHKFSDIATGTFFHNSTAWLKDNGIADGYNDGTFGPNRNITRGQASYWFTNYNDSLDLVGDNIDPGESVAFALDLTCPAGKRAIAGGGNTSETDLLMTDSYPPGDSMWRVRWESDDDTPIDPWFLNVWALCAPDTIP